MSTSTDAPPDSYATGRIRQIQHDAARKADRIAEIRRSLEVLHEPGTVVEIRSVKVGRVKTVSGYFTDLGKAAEACFTLTEHREAAAVYQTLNVVDSSLLARAANRLKDWAETTTGDHEIIRRQWLFIDLDPSRFSGIGSTDEQHHAAHRFAADIEDLLRQRGWPFPLHQDSGNGCYLLYKIDLPNDEDTAKLVKTFYEGLAQLTKDCAGDVQIDSGVFNAARIVRVGGTWNRKGDSLPDRPHRLSRMHEPSEECPVTVVPVELIREIAALAPLPKKPIANPARNTGDYPRLDVARFLASRQIEYRTKAVDGGMAYLLTCPFDPNHGSNGESCVVQADSGLLTYHCKHKTCQHRTWHDFKQTVGAPAADCYEGGSTFRSNGSNSKPSHRRLAVTAGQQVKALDRDNIGTIVQDSDEHDSACKVHFVSPDGDEATKEIPKSELQLLDGTPLEARDEPCRIELIPSSTFAVAEYRQRYLVNRILVADQPAIVGGRSKTMKTSIMVDLALSLGTGTPFLGEFHATTSTVAILSGETGQFTLQETARRIAKTKQIDLAQATVHWGFTLPQLARDSDLVALEKVIRDNGIQIAMIDPAYLCLLAGDVKGLRSSDMFSMGPLLLGLSELGSRCGCTMILAHHCRKNSPQEQFSPPDLEELSMAGFAEWARQWLLLGRREAYEQGSGIHRLWLNIGGSAGHSGCYGLDIDEGQLADDFSGRKWEVTVSHAAEARKDAERQRDLRKAKQQEEREEAYRGRLWRAIEAFPAGETSKTIRESAGLNPQNFGIALKFLLGEGRIEPCEITKGTRTYEGYKPTGK